MGVKRWFRGVVGFCSGSVGGSVLAYRSVSRGTVADVRAGRAGNRESGPAGAGGGRRWYGVDVRRWWRVVAEKEVRLIVAAAGCRESEWQDALRRRLALGGVGFIVRVEGGRRGGETDGRSGKGVAAGLPEGPGMDARGTLVPQTEHGCEGKAKRGRRRGNTVDPAQGNGSIAAPAREHGCERPRVKEEQGMDAAK